VALRDRAQFELYVQGPSRRCEAGGARIGRALCARRQRAQSRQPRAHHRPIDRTASGAHIWADRFDGTLDDIFELQDQVASSVVGAIEPRLRLAEIERATRKPTENLDAYDLYLRGLAEFHKSTPDMRQRLQ
jgi:hypothetical protein